MFVHQRNRGRKADISWLKSSFVNSMGGSFEQIIDQFVQTSNLGCIKYDKTENVLYIYRQEPDVIVKIFLMISDRIETEFVDIALGIRKHISELPICQIESADTVYVSYYVGNNGSQFKVFADGGQPTFWYYC